MFTLPDPTTHYLIASDFDQTLSFNDSGLVLSELLGIRDFDEKVAGLAQTNLVQQGAELAYLLRHDPEFRGVRREHLIAAGQGVRLRHDVPLLVEILREGFAGCSFHFNVISAGCIDVVRSALEGIVPPEQIFATEFDWDPRTGEICAVRHAPAGYGKVTVLEALEAKLHVSPDHTIYMGDGSSDLYVMQHVNSRDGHTIAVSETKSIGRIAKRTVLSDNATSVLVPILEDILHWDAHQVREFFASHRRSFQDWDKVRTDWLTFHENETTPDGQLLVAGS
jgi:phosphoserine phosphatase